MRVLPFLVLGLVLAVSTAGCFGGDDDAAPVLTMEACAAEGLELRSVNGTAMCLEPLPPAVVRIVGLPENVSAYHAVAFGWVLETHKNSSHAMRTSLHVSSLGAEDGALGGPGSFGTELARHEHQDFESGARYDVEHRFEEAGTYHLRAYAEVEGQQLWSAEAVVRVDAVQPTGESVTVTLPAGSAAQGASPADVTVPLGGFVRFVNDDLVERTFTFTGPAEVATVQVPRLAEADSAAFLVPGEYSYTSGEAAGAVSGTVTVQAP